MMDAEKAAERSRRLEQLYHSALEQAEAERDAFLKSACGADLELRRDVESLLAHDKDAENFIEAPALEMAAWMVARQRDQPPDEGSAGIIGSTISHYEIIEKLGEGGMGVVYKARDHRLGRLVALKFLPEDFARDPTAIVRFQREARAASSLNHRNICTIYDIGEEARQAFIAMEYLDGQTLKHVIESRPMESKRMLPLAIQIAEALDAAHRHGIIHRDVKPANIFVTREGQVKVLDFGLAKLARTGHGIAAESTLSSLDGIAEEQLTSTGTAIGTVAYMSPEQARGEELDVRTDLFSLGAVFYEMATGQVAFGGTTVAVVFDAILHRDPLSNTRLNSELPEGMTQVIAKALQKDCEQRYQSAAAVLGDLQAMETGKPAQVSVAERVASRRKLWVSAVAIVVIAAVIAVSLSFRQRQSHRLTEKDTIVLADFANSTGDPVFDDTLKTALSISLRQSPFLNVLADSEVARTLRLMTRPASMKLTPEVALELCLRAGSKAYIAGSIDSLGREYVVGLKAINCQSGDPLSEEQVTAVSEEKVLDALGKAASKLRSELGESLITVQKFDVPLPKATTSSLEALKAYSLGGKAGNEKGDASGLPYLHRAIELDPNFALGYDALGNEYSNLGEVERANEYFTKAFQLQEHASEREKLGITADYYESITGQLDKAARTYEEEIESYPRESMSYGRLGIVYAKRGQYEKAAEVARQAAEIAPANDVSTYENLANYTLALQRLDETRRIIHEAQARKLDGAVLRNDLYALAFLGSDWDAMAEQQRWFANKPEFENWGLALASDTQAYTGHVAKARDLTTQAVNSALRGESRENAAIYLANAAVRQAAYGNPVKARQSAAEA